MRALSKGTRRRGTHVLSLTFASYDWSGDGYWDHVAVVVGTNSAGQKVVDAHTTDYYRTYWKMGYSSTHYKFARVRAQWVV